MSAAGDVSGFKKGRVPGEVGLWILIFGDLIVFGLFFGTFAYYYLQQPDLFRAAQGELNQILGLLNTLLLLTSSYLVVKGLNAARRGEGVPAQRWTLAAIVFGLGFVAVKAVEYSEKIQAGIYPVTNDFFMLYFGFTGIHLGHVIVGLGALAFLRARLPNMAESQNFAIAEGCTIFWHLVDVLWVVLFAIFYLHR
ncbi:hypothetical protein IP78_05765 [Brevundimonas sp. AAP58]|uniref:cytochrome c oxidase subunit 3 n=1 Tax=Brevundimonas sp. AAP58 TaxID=1523422 RepID=UPI0006B94743|nr:cytochrome c oxidase subunit 3 [Brevundimonas sp. AAP58]KPF81158.1 hypothetical protein IP78_05765 [Brevundimonas sp. AAP58]